MCRKLYYAVCCCRLLQNIFGANFYFYFRGFLNVRKPIVFEAQILTVELSLKFGYSKKYTFMSCQRVIQSATTRVSIKRLSFYPMERANC